MYTKANLAALRVKKDIAELSQHRLNATHASTSIDFPDGTRNLLKLKVGVTMTAGLFEGATFYFILTIPPSYPFHAPTVVCTSRAWHPNIDLHTGLVSLPILTKDWRPVLSINTIVFALQLMFIEPTEHHAVNKPAAAALSSNPDLFREQVRRSLAGGSLFGVQFESQRLGGAADGKGSGHGAAKRKRGFGESMDTEAVQTTLEAMRIQGDDSPGTSSSMSAWDKRPRLEQQQRQQQQHRGEEGLPQPAQGSLHFPATEVAGGQQHQHQQHQQQQLQYQQQRHLATFGEPNALGTAAAGVAGLPQQQQQQHQSVIPSFGTSATAALQNLTTFDRLRCHAVVERQRSGTSAAGAAATPIAAAQSAASIGLRCGGGPSVAQAGIGVPQSPARVVGEGAGAGAVWGGGQFQVQTVPGASRLH
ncbi:unnamed protein product [Ectocarpus sp. 13 AM-2016]